jgi:hypothetical protein
MVRVEFVGLPSPYANKDVQMMLAQRPRSRTARMRQALYRQEVTRQEQERQKQGFARFQGRTMLTLGVQHGFSREYTWGPRVWEVEMDPHDVEVLMRMHPAHAIAFQVIPDIIRVSA